MLVNHVYNYLNAGLVPKKRTTTHKASELKAVYNSISKYNETSPLYLISLSESKQEHMINIKESALTLRDVAETLSNPESSLYTKKQFQSDNPDIVTGSFRKNSSGDLPDELTLEIHSLAKEQVNIGSYLPSEKASIPAGNYRIFMDTEQGRLPISISVKDGSTNRSLQDQLASAINSSTPAVQASVIQEGDNSSLMLVSSKSGITNTDSGLSFSFTEDGTSDFIDTLGLNHIQTKPQNATFSINDSVHNSTSNHISINQIVELDFHRVTEDPISIRFTPDTDLLSSQIRNFTEAYNSLVTISETSEPAIVGSRNLLHDISGIVNRHMEQFSSIGLISDESGRLVKDPDFTGPVNRDTFNQLFGADSTLKADILKCTNRLMLDPMAYINKLIVTYPNTNEKKMDTYTQSIYSGLMYNNYA